jgi:hypothetical protein
MQQSKWQSLTVMVLCQSLLMQRVKIVLGSKLLAGDTADTVWLTHVLSGGMALLLLFAVGR